MTSQTEKKIVLTLRKRCIVYLFMASIYIHWVLPHHPMPFVCVFWWCNAWEICFVLCKQCDPLSTLIHICQIGPMLARIFFILIGLSLCKPCLRPPAYTFTMFTAIFRHVQIQIHWKNHVSLCSSIYMCSNLTVTGVTWISRSPLSMYAGSVCRDQQYRVCLLALQ